MDVLRYRCWTLHDIPIHCETVYRVAEELTIFSEVSLLCFLAIQLIKAHELNLQSANFATANLSGRHRGMSSADFLRSVQSRSRGLSTTIPALIFKNNTGEI